MAGSLSLSVMIAEIIFRLAMPVTYLRPPEPVPQDVWRELVNKPSEVPGLAYELRPNVDKFAQGAPVRTNSHGMRDRDRSLEKAANTVRIAVLGDSFTFGFGVDSEETYPSVLERLLNESGARFKYEVLNFGVGGYSSKDEALVLRHKVMRWHPDVIVIGYVRNDPEIDPVQPLHAYYDKPRWWQHSHFLRKIAEARNEWDIKRYGDGDYVRYLHRHPTKWQSVRDAFRDIRQVTQLPVLVAVFHSDTERYIYEQVRSVAAEQRFTVVAVRDGSTAYSLEETRLPDGHPNTLGHRRAAGVIKEALVSNRLVPQ